MTKLDLKKQLRPPLADNPSAPDMFADEAIGFFMVNNTLRITLTSTKIDFSANPGSKSRTVVGRLVMPIAAAEEFNRKLADAIERLTKGIQETDIGTSTLQ